MDICIVYKSHFKGKWEKLNTRTGGGSENHTDWRGAYNAPPPIDLSSYES